MADDKNKPFNKDEKFVCEMLWGNVPIDVAWARGTTMFENGMKRFADGEWTDLIIHLKQTK